MMIESYIAVGLLSLMVGFVCTRQVLIWRYNRRRARKRAILRMHNHKKYLYVRVREK